MRGLLHMRIVSSMPAMWPTEPTHQMPSATASGRTVRPAVARTTSDTVIAVMKVTFIGWRRSASRRSREDTRMP